MEFAYLDDMRLRYKRRDALYEGGKLKKRTDRSTHYRINKLIQDMSVKLVLDSVLSRWMEKV